MPTEAELTEEITRLKVTNTDLLTKKNNLKARVAELEQANTALQSKADASEQTMRRVLVDAPLDVLAKDVSHLPSIWKSEFLKRYKLELDDKQEVQLQALDGKPVLGKDGKPIPLTYSAIAELLTGGDAKKANEEDQKMFLHIIKSKATGGGAGNASSPTLPHSQAKKEEQKKPLSGLGLR